MKELLLTVLFLTWCSLLSIGAEAQGILQEVQEVTRGTASQEWTLGLKAGWNWVSFPRLPGDRKVGSVLGKAGFSVNDLIQASNANARFTGSGWLPASFAVDYGTLYKVYVEKDVNVTIAGETSGVSSLAVTAGWNWIGNPAENAVAPAELKHSAGFSAGDRILDCATSVTYNGSQWIPSSGFSLEPGKGYQLYTAKAGNLKFAEEEQGTYLVVDLSGGTTATSYPWRYTNEAPDVTKDECRTTELWLRRIPAGTFTMGSPEDEPDHSGIEKQHQVTLTEDFYIGVFECTQKQWELVMGTRPSYFSNEEYYATRPVEKVSYWDIRGFNWPTSGHKVNGNTFMGTIRQKTGLVFDLPTEAQWEYACRKRADGTCWNTALNSGKTISSLHNCENLAELGRYRYNGGEEYNPTSTTANGSTKVGSYQPSELGLYDMHGNVWEWNLDWYDSYEGDAVNPTGPKDGTFRMVRGGSYNCEAYSCRAAYRNCFQGERRDVSFGFRAVFLPSCSLTE